MPVQTGRFKNDPKKYWRQWAKEHRESRRAASKKYYTVKGKVRNERIRNEIRSFVNTYKSTYGCLVCGEKHPACLQFHHKNPTLKEFTIGEFISRTLSLERVQQEILKCSVLCANCHFKLHWSERQDING